MISSKRLSKSLIPTYILNLLIIGYLTYSNLFFSKRYSLTQMRAIDDFAMQYSVHQMQLNIFSFEFSKIFYYFEYAYGWIFWMAYSVSTFPFYLYTRIAQNELSEQLAIFTVRQVTVVILCLILVFSQKMFYEILKESTDNAFIISKYLATSWLLYPAVGFWAGRPQPPMLVTLMIIIACYRLLKLEVIRAKNLMHFIVIMFLIVGTKLNAVLVIPYVFALMYLYRKIEIQKAIKKLRLLHTLAYSIIAFFVGSSPLILLSPKENGLKFLRNIELFSSLSLGQEFSAINFMANLNIGLLKNTFGFSSLIVFATIFAAIISRKKLEVRRNLILLLLLLATILLIARISVNGPLWFNSYLLPLSIFFPIHLYFLVPDKQKNIFIIAPFFILTGLASLILSFSRIDAPTESINSYQVIHERAILSNEYQLRAKIERIIDSYKDEKIGVIQDYTIPTAKTNFDSSVNLEFIYGQWSTSKSASNSSALFLLVDYRQHLDASDIERNRYDTRDALVRKNSRKDEVLDKLNKTKDFNGSSCTLLEIVKGVGVYRCTGG